MFKWFIPTVVAVICGLIVLLGALLPIQILDDFRAILVQWTAVISVFAFILAYSSIMKIHLTRAIRRRKDRISSIILLISALATLTIVIVQGSNGIVSQYIVQYILIPGESALFALTAVTLVFAGMRVFRNHRDFYGLLFLIVVCFTLFSTVPYFYHVIIETTYNILNSAAIAGMRGILLGVVLGTTLTGIRIIFGIDRPYTSE
jgi:hypothetical protein